MSKIKDIQNAVTVNGMRKWTDQRVRQAMREYAKEVAQDALKRAAENVHIEMVIPDGTDLDKLGTDGLNISVEDVPNYKIRINKQSILSTLINTDL